MTSSQNVQLYKEISSGPLYFLYCFLSIYLLIVRHRPAQVAYLDKKATNF